MTMEPASVARSGTSSDRTQLALLSALAEAPDLDAAAGFLLSHVLGATGARRAYLLGFDTAEQQLVLISHTGVEDAPVELAIAERAHPWMVATLAQTPVVADGTSKPAARTEFPEWTALPMPRPHYRGAPALWADSYAAEVLAPIGARLVPRDDRGFASAPGGVVIVDTALPPALIEEIGAIVMYAGPVIARVASHLDAERGYERVSQESSRFQQMVD